MGTEYTTREIKQKYDDSASKYAFMERVQEFIGLKRLRRRQVGKASGAVLEVACGTGANFQYYPTECELTAVDVSPEMMTHAKQRAEKRGLEVDFQLNDAEALAFPDEQFDTVVSTLTLCTFPNPIAALGEMQRVVKTDGRILLIEHGRSNNRLVAWFQDVRADAHAQQLGCHWNREPLKLLAQAGLSPVSTRRTFLGIFHEIEAQ
ncbi:class I SAM-dependent methyltransferase [Halocatena halophila]|uniref:class I SAM-dependent methyltransferase n=1 Tax=Halocatena halophila TaxID=2814576 RepID=UPI002ECFE97B